MGTGIILFYYWGSKFLARSGVVLFMECIFFRTD